MPDDGEISTRVPTGVGGGGVDSRAFGCVGLSLPKVKSKGRERDSDKETSNQTWERLLRRWREFRLGEV